MQVDPSIFRKYDIRAIWGKNLNEEIAYLIGRAFGTYFHRHGQTKVVVNRDNRLSGQAIKDNLIKGILETGLDVVDLDIATSPMSYASWYLLDANATVDITASHNPPEYNGFKAGLNKEHFIDKQYAEIKDLVLNQDFDSSDTPGKLSTYDIWPAYRQAVTKDIQLKKPVKVVLDCGNGTTSTSTPQILQDIGCEVIQLFCQHDGSFPNHAPYPQKENFYTELKKAIKEHGADMGIAMDGDGDRFGVYDENGNFVSNDLIGALIGIEIAQEHPGFKAVFNVSTSKQAIDHLENHGAKVTLWKTGYPYIISKMKEIGALLGNEIAGHFFLKDRYWGFDDGTYAAARFIEYYSSQNQTVSQLVAAMPQYLNTPEFRVPAPDEPDRNKFTIIRDITQEFKQKFPQAEVMDFDGMRIAFPDGSWILIRNSNTEPLVTGRAEAKTLERLEELKQLVVETLAKHDVHLDWSNPIPSH